PRWTADVAPAVVNACRPPFVVGRIHADCRRDHANADRLEALQPDVAVTKGLHRRHRIRRARRPPDLLGLRITRYPDVARDFVVVRRQVLVGDWPVQRAAMLALDLEIVRQQAREICEVMQRGAADSPAGLIAIGDGMPALENEWAAGVLEAPPPGIRADEISGFPVRTLFQNDHLLPGF